MKFYQRISLVVITVVLSIGFGYAFDLNSSSDISTNVTTQSYSQDIDILLKSTFLGVTNEVESEEKFRHQFITDSLDDDWDKHSLNARNRSKFNMDSFAMLFHQKFLRTQKEYDYFGSDLSPPCA